MQTQYIIYKITNKVNNKFYIGSSKNFKKRIHSHLSQLRGQSHHNNHLQNSFNKYGEHEFTFEPLYCVLCESDMLLCESNFIKEMSPHYNIGEVGGGDNYKNLSECRKKDVREKQSKASKAYWDSLTDEEMKEYCDKMKGEGNPNYGNRWTDEQKRIASERGKINSEKNPHIAENLRSVVVNFWKNISPEELENFKKMRSFHTKGERNPMFGKRVPKESLERGLEKKRIRRENAIKAGVLEDILKTNHPFFAEGNRYISLIDASEKLGVPKGTIKRRLLSSSFCEYYYEDEDYGIYTPVNRTGVIVKTNGAVSLCFISKAAASEFYGISKATIERFHKKGVSEGSKLFGHEFIIYNYSYTKTHPNLR
jgi:group I intron endonuclease